MGTMLDEISNKGSVWSEIPPSPRAANRRMIWKNKVYEKNQITRGQNAATGRLSQYIIGDPDAKIRLDSKLKAVTARVSPSGGHRTS